MEELSEYELQRQKNIQANQDKLHQLGLMEDKLVPEKDLTPKARKRSRSPPPLQPTRKSSRQSGIQAPSYAESSFHLDEVDPDDDRPRKRGRPRQAPSRYENDYPSQRRERLPRPIQPDWFQMRAETIAKIPSQPPSLPSKLKIMEFVDANVTLEQLTEAGYPQATLDAFKDLAKNSYSTRTCPYKLMPFSLYDANYTGKFKVQCEICKEHYCFSMNTGKIHLHSRCHIIAKKKEEEALNTAGRDF